MKEKKARDEINKYKTASLQLVSCRRRRLDFEHEEGEEVEQEDEAESGEAALGDLREPAQEEGQGLSIVAQINDHFFCLLICCIIRLTFMSW